MSAGLKPSEISFGDTTPVHPVACGEVSDVPHGLYWRCRLGLHDCETLAFPGQFSQGGWQEDLRHVRDDGDDQGQ